MNDGEGEKVELAREERTNTGLQIMKKGGRAPKGEKRRVKKEVGKGGGE